MSKEYILITKQHTYINSEQIDFDNAIILEEWNYIVEILKKGICHNQTVLNAIDRDYVVLLPITGKLAYLDICDGYAEWEIKLYNGDIIIFRAMVID